jgi:hypothetical protein
VVAAGGRDVSARWTVEPDEQRDGTTRWRVHDQQDAGRPVAEFASQDAARAHVARLSEGPFDLDEQEAWQDEDDEDDEDREDDDADDEDASSGWF